MDRMCNRAIGGQIITMLACIPDRLLPQRPEIVQIMLQEFIDWNYGKNEDPPDWWKEEFCSKNW